MALSWRARRIWSMVILIVGLPVYVVVAVTIMDLLRERLGRPVWWLEVLIFVGLGLLWALPFRSLFQGIGRDDPNAGKAPRE
jgi:branched-subunit amino acid transport protein